MQAPLPFLTTPAQHYMDRLRSRLRSMGTTTANVRRVVQLDLERLAYLFAGDERTAFTFTLNTLEQHHD